MTVTNPTPGVASPVNLITIAAAVVLANKLAAGDANPAFQIGGDGTLSWGPGGGSPIDTQLFRSGGVLTTQQAFQASAGVRGGSGAAIVAVDNNGPGGAGAIRFQGGEAGSNLYRSAAGVIATDGVLRIATAGNGLRVAEGANAKQGTTGAMTAGAVTVANTSVTANSRIFVCRSPGGTNPGAWYVSAQTAGTSFVVTSTNAADTGSGVFMIFEPA